MINQDYSDLVATLFDGHRIKIDRDDPNYEPDTTIDAVAVKHYLGEDPDMEEIKEARFLLGQEAFVLSLNHLNLQLRRTQYRGIRLVDIAKIHSQMGNIG